MECNKIVVDILSSDKLPALPEVAQKLIHLTNKEEVSLHEIASLIEKDVALSVKVLRIVNSSFYSLPQKVGDIYQAVVVLGLDAVRSLILSFCFLSFANIKSKTFDFREFWQKSLASAIASKLILEHVEGVDANGVLLPGLLQNLGEFIFALILPAQYGEVRDLLMEGKDEDICQAERTVFTIDHSILGYEVATSWGLPSDLCLTILCHHKPNLYDGDDPVMKYTLAAVYLSSVIIQILESDRPDLHLKKFKRQASSLLGLPPKKVDHILSILHKEIERAGEQFDYAMGAIASISDVLQEANIRLSLLNLNYEQINRELVASKIELERLTEELEEKSKHLEMLINVDGLTGVYTHRFFQNSLNEEIERSIRKSCPLSLILLDIDGFKKFNDLYGHQLGDLVLCEMVNVLLANLRAYDILARYGGEEFAIILPNTGAEDAYAVAEKLRLKVAQKVIEEGGAEYRVKISLGLSTGTPALEHHFSKNKFIKEADIALYQAKANGRNRTEVFGNLRRCWF